MTCLRLFLVNLLILMTNVSTGGSPTRLEISLKLNIKNRNKDPQICTTAACNETAQLVAKYIDFKADPCEDFYQFTCGNLIKEIPPGKTRVGSNVNMAKEVRQRIKVILEEPPSEAKNNLEKQTKMSFQACVDTTTIDNGGAKALKEVVKKFGGWPLVEGDKWKEEECNLTTIFTEYELHGMLSIFGVSMLEFPLIWPSHIPTPDDPYKANSTILGIYKQFVLNANLYLVEMEKSDNFIKAVDDIINFGKSVSECEPGRRTPINASNIENLKQIFDKIFDIESFFKSYYKNAGFDLAPNETIGIFNPSYFDCLMQLLEVTSKRTIVNYLVWRMIERTSVAMPKQFLEFSNTFKSEIGFPSKNIIRWESCIEIISDKLDKALLHMYVIRHLNQASKNKVLDQLNRIKNSFKGLIANEKWLTKDSKVAMIAKIDQTRDNIGCPDYIYDPRYFDDDFNWVDFSGKSFLEMFLTINMMKVKDAFKLMKHPGMMIMPATYINGMHVEYKSEIAFSAAIFSPPYYSESSPTSFNFGGVGNTMGHEITHALGIIGHTVVVNGVTRQLWEGETRENFIKRSECLIKQFDGIPTDLDLKLNGDNTKAENIADAGGLRIAYRAYKKWLNEFGEEKQLPGFPYNSEQMYFIGFGMAFCRRHTNESPEYRPYSGHPPHKIRVNMAVKNFRIFSKVFKCKANSEMVISKRCRVW